MRLVLFTEIYENAVNAINLIFIEYKFIIFPISKLTGE